MTVREEKQHANEAYFVHLARHDPARLADLLQVGVLPPEDLTFAAEMAGNIQDSELIRPALLRLLEHSSAVVREGAILGLDRHLDDRTRERLRELAMTDPSPGVRVTARDALDL